MNRGYLWLLLSAKDITDPLLLQKIVDWFTIRLSIIAAAGLRFHRLGIDQRIFHISGISLNIIDRVRGQTG
jgi:hypothetical protein